MRKLCLRGVKKSIAYRIIQLVVTKLGFKKFHQCHMTTQSGSGKGSNKERDEVGREGSTTAAEPCARKASA